MAKNLTEGIGRIFSSSIKIILTQNPGPRVENVVGRGLLTNYTPNRTLKTKGDGAVLETDKKTRAKRSFLKQNVPLRKSDEFFIASSPNTSAIPRKSTRNKMAAGSSRLSESPYAERSSFLASLGQRLSPIPSTDRSSSSRHQKHGGSDVFEEDTAFDVDRPFFDRVHKDSIAAVDVLRDVGVSRNRSSRDSTESDVRTTRGSRSWTEEDYDGLLYNFDAQMAPKPQEKTSRIDTVSNKKRQDSSADNLFLPDDDFTSYLLRRQRAEKKAREEDVDKLEEFIRDIKYHPWDKDAGTKIDSEGLRKASSKKSVDFKTTDEKMKSIKTPPAESCVPSNTSRVSRTQPVVGDLKPDFLDTTTESRKSGRDCNFKPVSSRSPKIPDPILAIKPDEISSRLKSTKIDQPLRQPQPSLPIQVNRRTTGVLLMDQGYAYQDVPSTSQAKHSSARSQQRSWQDDKEAWSKRLRDEMDKRIDSTKSKSKKEPRSARKSTSVPSLNNFETAPVKRTEGKPKEAKKTNNATSIKFSSPARFDFKRSFGTPISFSSPRKENKSTDKNNINANERLPKVKKPIGQNGLGQESKKAVESAMDYSEMKKRFREAFAEMQRERMKKQEIELRTTTPETSSPNISDKRMAGTANYTDKATSAFNRELKETVSSRLGNSVRSRANSAEVFSKNAFQSPSSKSLTVRPSRSATDILSSSKHSGDMNGYGRLERDGKKAQTFDQWVNGMRHVDRYRIRPADDRGGFEDENGVLSKPRQQGRDVEVEVNRILDRVSLTNRKATPLVEALLSTPGLSRTKKRKLMSMLHKSDVLVSMTLAPVEETKTKEMFPRKTTEEVTLETKAAAAKLAPPANQKRELTKKQMSDIQKSFKEMQLQRFTDAFERYQERLEREKEERRRIRLAKKKKKQKSL